MNLKIKKLHPDAMVPTYATPGAACFDLYGVANVRHAAGPGSAVNIGTGLAFEVPKDHVMLVFSRSGHGFKNQVRLSNCVGVIDSDFRGELRVQLRNDQREFEPGLTGRQGSAEGCFFTVGAGDRIAQAMVLPVTQVQFEVVDELSETERGEGGLGSTGA